MGRGVQVGQPRVVGGLGHRPHDQRLGATGGIVGQTFDRVGGQLSRLIDFAGHRPQPRAEEISLGQVRIGSVGFFQQAEDLATHPHRGGPFAPHQRLHHPLGTLEPDGGQDRAGQRLGLFVEPLGDRGFDQRFDFGEFLGRVGLESFLDRPVQIGLPRRGFAGGQRRGGHGRQIGQRVGEPFVVRSVRVGFLDWYHVHDLGGGGPGGGKQHEDRHESEQRRSQPAGADAEAASGGKRLHRCEIHGWVAGTPSAGAGVRLGVARSLGTGVTVEHAEPLDTGRSRGQPAFESGTLERCPPPWLPLTNLPRGSPPGRRTRSAAVGVIPRGPPAGR